MKTSKVWALMKKSKQLFLICFGDEQWCSDGVALYNVSAVPKMTPEQFLAIISVEEGEEDKYTVRFKNEFTDLITCNSDYYEEVPAEEFSTDFISCGNVYKVLSAFGGEIVAFDPKYLAPFADNPDVELYCRRPLHGNDRWIAVKYGWLTLGIICPKMKFPESVLSDIRRIMELSQSQTTPENWDNREPLTDEEHEELEPIY